MRNPEFGYFLENLELLSADDRLEFSLINHEKITEFDQLIATLNFFKNDSEKFALISHFSNLVKNIDQLEILVHLLKDSPKFAVTLIGNHVDVVHKHSDVSKIRSALENNDYFSYLEDVLDKKLYPVYMTKLSDSTLAGEVKSLQEELRSLPIAKRFAFAKRHHHKIFSIGYEYLEEFFKLLPEKQRISMFEEMTNQGHSAAALLAMLKTLPDAQRISIAKKYSNQINNSNQLLEVFLILPAHQRLQYLMMFPDWHGIQNLDEIFLALTNDEQIKLGKWLMAPANLQKFVYHNPEHILLLYPFTQRSAMADKYLEAYQSTLLPEGIKKLATTFKEVRTRHVSIEMGFKLAQILKMLPEPERYAYLLKQIGEITINVPGTEDRKHTNLFPLVSALPEDQRELFLETYYEKIPFSIPVAIVGLLPAGQRVAFLERHEVIILCNDLARLVNCLAYPDKEAFAHRHINKIDNGFALAGLVAVLPKARRVNFAETYLGKISCVTVEQKYDFNELVRAFPEEDRLAFVEKHLARIPQLKAWQVLEVLSAADQATYIKNHQVILLANSLVWPSVFKMLSKKVALAFADECSKTTSSEAGFRELVAALPAGLRSAFVKAHFDKITSGAFFAEIVTLLPNGYAFAVKHAALLNAFPEGKRQAVNKLVESLPIDQALNFIASCCNDDHAGFLLAKLLSERTLPGEWRVELAKQYSNLIKGAAEEDKFDLVEVLKLLPESERYNFAIDQVGKLKLIPGSIEVLGLLRDSLKGEFGLAMLGNFSSVAEQIEILKAVSMTPARFAKKIAETIYSGISSESEFVAIVHALRAEQGFECITRFEFINEKLDYVQGLSEAAKLSLLESLHDQEQCQAFIDAYFVQITLAAALPVILKKMPASARYAFAIKHQALISAETDESNHNNLADVLGSLSFDDRKAFADSQASKIKTATDLNWVLFSFASVEEKFEFLSEHSDKVQNSDDLVKVLSSFWREDDEEVKLKVILLFKEKIASPAQLINVISKLKEKNNIVSVLLQVDQLLIANPEFMNGFGLEFFFVSAENVFAQLVSNLFAHVTNEQALDFFDMVFGKLPSLNNVLPAKFLYMLQQFPPEQRYTIADRYRHLSTSDVRIGDDSMLVKVIALLPAADRLAFAKSQAAIINANPFELTSVLALLPVEVQYDFFLEQAPKIHRSDLIRFILVLTNLTLGQDRIMGDVKKIVAVWSPEQIQAALKTIMGTTPTLINVEELLYALRNTATYSLWEEKSVGIIHQLLNYCIPEVRIAYYAKHNMWNRELFASPITQEMFSLKRLDPNLFLFAAAVDLERETDFEFLLSHPTCSAFALNDRAQDLEMVIQASALSDALKKMRVTKLKERQEAVRLSNAASYIGIDLSSLQLTALKFEGALPEVAKSSWSIEGVEDELITYFQQLIAWLNTQEKLAPFQANFVTLANNTLIRQKTAFRLVVADLDSFVAVVARYLNTLRMPSSEAEARTQARILVSHLDACKQLGACAEGVRSALQSMTRALNPHAALMNVVDVAVDQCLGAIVRCTGVKAEMEVHLSKDRVLRRLGMNIPFVYDAYRLPLSDFNIQAMGSQAMNQLTPDRLWRESLPSLESTTLLKEASEEKPYVWDAALAGALERDWFSLHAAGLLAELSHASKVDYLNAIKDLYPLEEPPLLEEVTELKLRYLQVLAYISKNDQVELMRLTERYALAEEVKLVLPLKSPHELAAHYRASLLKKGILSLTSVQSEQLQATIWQLLIKEQPWGAEENALWQKLLTAPNGLGWIKAVIESRSSEEWMQIKLSALLHCPPGLSCNLFRALACDPFSAGWMMGWEMQAIAERIALTRAYDIKLEFRPLEQQPLATVLAALMSSENELRMHCELEYAFVAQGAFSFWLSELQKDVQRQSTYKCVLQYVCANELYRYDSLLSLLGEMTQKGSDEEKVMALSLLEDRCIQQRELKLWDCYWKTACFTPGFEIKLTERDMALSLKDSSNLRKALYLAKTTQNLVTLLVKAVADRVLTPVELKEITAPLTKPDADTNSAAVVDADSGVEEHKFADDEAAETRGFRP